MCDLVFEDQKWVAAQRLAALLQKRQFDRPLSSLAESEEAARYFAEGYNQTAAKLLHDFQNDVSAEFRSDSTRRN
jgi:hypothetical protein